MCVVLLVEAIRFRSRKGIAVALGEVCRNMINIAAGNEVWDLLFYL